MKKNTNVEKVEIEKKHKKIEEDTTISKIKNKLNEHNFFFKNFLEKLKVDKIYLISFLITLTFLSVTSVIKVKHADGYLNKNQTDINQKENNDDTTLTPAKDAEQEEIDVSDYVGIYSKEYILDNVITFGENCTVDSYKYIYQINNDGTISKYFNNSCIGTIKIWSDKFKYNNNDGARYIGTKNMNYTFNTNKLKEVDGETYKIDTDITTIKESKNIEEIELSFYGLNTIIMTNTNLILLNKEKASSPISEEYTSPVTSLKKRFYKSSNEYQYNFIVFNTDIDEICATQEPNNIENVETSEETYKIYSIRYDASSDNFLEPKMLVSRTKSDSCENYKKDLSILKE